MVFRLFFLFLTLSACSSANHIVFDKETTESRFYKIELSSMVHIPYCGGAYPGPEEARGYNVSSDIKSYFLTTDSIFTSESVYQTVEISEDGVFHFRIQNGTYFVQHPDKKLSLAEFMTKNSSQNSNQTISNSDCYLKWKNTPDFKLVVTKDTSVQIIYRSACFTGTNPCLGYDGPYPP